jgi:uncharacterized protein YegL
MPKGKENGFMNANQDLVELVVIIDKSGSMGGIRNDAIGGFNAFLSDQKKLPGEAKMTLVMFDDGYYLVHDGVDLKDVPDLDTKGYQPSGSTALLDAIGKTVDKVDKRNATRKAANEEIPRMTIMAILTDGEENASTEYRRDQIKTLLTEKQEKENWKIIYLGANVDAFAEARSMGISQQTTYTYSSSGQGINRAYTRGMSNVACSLRSGDDSYLQQSHDLTDQAADNLLINKNPIGGGGTYTTTADVDVKPVLVGKNKKKA